VVGLNVLPYPDIKIMNIIQCAYLGPCRVASTLRNYLVVLGGLYLKTERKSCEKGKKKGLKNEKMREEGG
jgi:hypothetical protein